MTTGPSGYKLSREFKLTFACVCLALSMFDVSFSSIFNSAHMCALTSLVFGKITLLSLQHVDVHTLRRDTVSSVGMIPQQHPYTSVNYSVKYFRHALALDERRARFRPNMWAEHTVNHEQELDVDFPIPDIDVDKKERVEWQYKPPKRNHADVKEVWFAGDLTCKNAPVYTYNF
jgi:uncharacterized protein (DUF2235 family)